MDEETWLFRYKHAFLAVGLSPEAVYCTICAELAAARREGAEEMREAAAEYADTHGQPVIAKAIRALPLRRKK